MLTDHTLAGWGEFLRHNTYVKFYSGYTMFTRSAHLDIDITRVVNDINVGGHHQGLMRFSGKYTKMLVSKDRSNWRQYLNVNDDHLPVSIYGRRSLC